MEISLADKLDTMCRDLADSLEAMIGIAKPASRHERLTAENGGDVLTRARADLPALIREIKTTETTGGLVGLDDVIGDLECAVSEIRSAAHQVEMAVRKAAG